MFKKQQNATTQINELKKLFKTKKKVKKLQKFRNVYKKNFEKANVKIIFLFINKKNIKKNNRKFRTQIKKRKTIYIYKKL